MLSEKKYIFTQRLVHECYSSIIQNSPKLEAFRYPNGDWIKMWYISTMVYYLTIKGNEVLINGITWMNLRNRLSPDARDYMLITVAWNVLKKIKCVNTGIRPAGGN